MNTEKKALIVFALVTAAAALCMTTGCASVPRNRWTDKTMRIMVDPDGIDAGNYVRVTHALVSSEKWVVVDRGQGFTAVKKEQEREQTAEAPRFADREKFAHWAKLYGIGGVVVAHTQCQQKATFFFKGTYSHCQQYLAILDANTAEVIAAVEGSNDTNREEYEIAPDWKDVTQALNDAYPKNYKPVKDTEILENYKQLSAEESQRMKEK